MTSIPEEKWAYIGAIMVITMVFLLIAYIATIELAPVDTATEQGLPFHP